MMKRLRGYAGDVGHAIERAPAEATLALLLAAAFSAAIHIEAGDGVQAWLETATMIAIAGAGACTATLLHAMGVVSARVRWAITLGGLLVAALYGITLLDLERSTEAWRAVSLVAAAWLFTAWSPSLAGGPRTEVFRRVNGRVLVRTIGAALYGAGLFIGLALAIGAVDTLFELSMEGRVYGHVFGWIAFLLIPLVVLGGVDGYAAADEAPDRVRAVTHRLTTWLVVPLLGVYLAILYAYAVRIAITGELPQNLVSPLVIAAGLLGALTLVLVDPRPDGDARSGVLRLVPLLFLPLAALGLWALWLRIAQYGVTEFRYLRVALLIALSLLTAAALLRLVRRQRLHLHRIPLVLGAVLALGAIGPWSAQSLSLRSQRSAMADALSRAGFDPSETLPVVLIAPGDSISRDTVPADLYETIRSVGQYLREAHGPSALRPWVDADAPREVTSDLARHIGLAPDQDPDEMHMAFAHLNAGVTVTAPGGARYERIVLDGGPNSAALTVRPDGTIALTAQVGGRSARIDVTRVLDWSAGREGVPVPASLAVLPLLDAEGTYVGEVLLLYLGIRREGGEYQLMRLDAVARLDAGKAEASPAVEPRETSGTSAPGAAQSPR